MLRKRVIPVVLLDGFSVLKTIGFDQRRNLGSPITVVRTYNTRNVDELILLDIDASRQGRSIDKFTIQDLANDCFMPLTVGGGIKTLDDIEALLKVGADKVVINSYALDNPDFIREASQVFGSQCIVVSVDVLQTDSGYRVCYKGKPSGEAPLLIEWLRKVEKLGAGEVMINCVNLDGSMLGADITLARLCVEELTIPMIYVGGVSSPENCADLLEEKVSAAGVASLFHFTDITPDDCRTAMKQRNIPAR